MQSLKTCISIDQTGKCVVEIEPLINELLQFMNLGKDENKLKDNFRQKFASQAGKIQWLEIITLCRDVRNLKI